LFLITTRVVFDNEINRTLIISLVLSLQYGKYITGFRIRHLPAVQAGLHQLPPHR